MSAIFVLRQSTAVHMMTDGLAYTSGARIVRNNLAKALVLPTLNAAVAATGAGSVSTLAADMIATDFSSFDRLVDEAADYLPELFNRFAIDCLGGDLSSSIYIIGWHEAARRPAAYSMEYWTDNSARAEAVRAQSGRSIEHMAAVRSKLIEQTFSGTPMPPQAARDAAGFRMLPKDDDFDPATDMLHLMEIARRTEIDGAHWIGGKALLTSISAGGITQRVVQHWSEDRIGQLVCPEPINWSAWARERRRYRGLSGWVPRMPSHVSR